jgi:hypothetical protein
MKTANLPLKKSFVFLILAFLTAAPNLAAAAAPMCSQILIAAESFDAAKRSELINQIGMGKRLPDWTAIFSKEDNLIYKGQHDYMPGSEFLASNEFDWARTPYSKKKADVLVAFGTNSAWEIIIAQSPKEIIMADWSPQPLMAHEYLITPLMKIANTPQEFISLLSGHLPTEATNRYDMDVTLKHAVQSFGNPSRQQFIQVQNLLKYLTTRPEITEKEFEFLASYYVASIGYNYHQYGFGPFKELRGASFANFVNFYEGRYDQTSFIENNGKAALSVMKEFGSITSLENFTKLRSYFVEGKIKYAVTSVMDTEFYSQVIKDNQAKGLNKMVLSVTNIFDCGCYNELTFQHYQALLKFVGNEMKVQPGGPELTVYRTTNHSPPHGFHRYDIDNITKVPEKDEADSVAEQGRPVKLDILPQAM